MNNIILNRTFYVYCIRMYIVNQKKSRHKTLFFKYFSDLPVYTKKKGNSYLNIIKSSSLGRKKCKKSGLKINGHNPK